MLKSFVISKQVDVEIPNDSRIMEDINNLGGFKVFMEKLALCQENNDFSEITDKGYENGIDFFVEDNGMNISERDD